MEDRMLLEKISKIQRNGKSLVKILGVLMLNPLSIGFITSIALKMYGGSWWYMWIPTIIALVIVYFLISNLCIGLIVQSLSIKLYSKMNEGEEKTAAYVLIKE